MTTFRVQMKERHCSHCFQCLFSQPRAGFFFSLFPRGHSRRRCVGFPRSPRSHTDVCSRGFTASPPSCNTNGVGEMLPCHKPDGLTDEWFGFDNAKVHSGITGRKKESVKRHGWRDPSGQGCVYSGFPLCRLSRRPGLREDGFIFSTLPVIP